MNAFLQSCLPQKSISRFMGVLARCRWGWFKNAFIKWFIKQYHVNLREAERSHYRQYESFNDFFTRRLKPDARPIVQGDQVIVSPVDGFVSAFGKIDDKTLLQAKGHTFSLQELLAGKAELAQHFRFGEYLTAYLAPSNYHRFHIPIAGTLSQMIYVPGDLYSVNAKSVESVPNLFARNERVISLFDTAIGPMAYIAVGAINVGSITMNWHGRVNPKYPAQVKTYQYQHSTVDLHFNKGDELGFFEMGSTVIVLFAPNQVQWSKQFDENEALVFGQEIARL